MNDQQLQAVLDEGVALGNRLGMAEQFIDAMVVSGLIQALRVLRTKLDPPAQEAPHLAMVPAAEGA